MNLRERISKIFPKTPLPKYRLSDAEVMDGLGDLTRRFEET